MCGQVFDPYHTGSIWESEISDAMRLFGISAKQEEVHDLVKEADIDNDGSIGFTEFVMMVVKAIHPLTWLLLTASAQAEESCEHSEITLKVCAPISCLLV